MKQEKQKRVLIIDDNKPLLKVLQDFLAFKGFDVVVAESGEEGLAKIAVSPPDIILLDISMPGMGGIGFLKRIMSGSGALQYPVLVFTARTTTEDYFRGLPVDGFIAKPCDKSELVTRIQMVLEKHRKATHKTILVGEDDPKAADRLINIFSGAGFKVEEAGTGPEVLEKAVVCLPDVLLLKQILTGMNGDVVVTILQAMPRTQSMPAILYDTSVLAEEEKDRLKHTKGITKCLGTQDETELLKVVKEVLHIAAPVPGAKGGAECACGISGPESGAHFR